jgi:hypothetical protein
MGGLDNYFMDVNVFYLYLWGKKYVIKRQISSCISLCKHQFMKVREQNESSKHPLRQRFISIIESFLFEPRLGQFFMVLLVLPNKCRDSALNLVTTTSCRIFPTSVRVTHNLSRQLNATFISAIEKYPFVPIRERQDGPQKRTGQVC